MHWRPRQTSKFLPSASLRPVRIAALSDSDMFDVIKVG